MPQRGRTARPWHSLLGVRIALRMLLAALLSCTLVGLGAEGMLVSSAPRWVALMVEPFSLLLVPGAFCAYFEARLHKLDFSAATVLRVSLIFYFCFFALLLLEHLRRRWNRGQGASR